MTFLILAGIIGLLLLLSYVFTIKHHLKIQAKSIEGHLNTIERERIAHKQTKAQLDAYIMSYNQALEHIRHLNSLNGISEKTVDYDMDEILNEISIKGIENVSKDKLEFLKKIGKQ